MKNILKLSFIISSITAISLIILSCQSSQNKDSKASASGPSQGSFVNQPNNLISESRQLTFSGPRSGEGYFSADDKKMIFQSEREPGNPFYQMFIMDLDSGKTTRLSPGNGKTTCGWIHPNMKKAMWSSTHMDPQWKQKTNEEYETRKKPVRSRYSWSYDEHFDIFESDLKGQSIKRLTKELGYDAEGSYSPNGQYIAFASNRVAYSEALSPEDEKMFKQDASYMMDIYIMRADGSDVKRLTTEKGYDGGPFFSPDGKKIVWRRFAPNGATAEIYTMNIDGSEQKQITRLKSMSWAPIYHPSQDYIVFASSVLGYSNFELFIVDAEGKQDPIRVTFDEGFDGLAMFSHDGHQLTWTHRNEKGESQIYLAEWDDALARKLLKLPPKDLKNLKPEIRKQDAKDIIYYLSSDEMKGRKTGSDEEVTYTSRIVQLLRSWGYVGGGPKGEFIQSFEFTSGVQLGANNSFEFVGAAMLKPQVSVDYIPLSASMSGSAKESPLIFVGYGIRAPATDQSPGYDSYKDVDVKGKWVVVLNDIPMDVSPERRYQLNLYGRLQHKITVAQNLGAVGLIVVNGPYSNIKEDFEKIKFEGSLSNATIAVVKMNAKIIDGILKKENQNLSDLQRKLDKGEILQGIPLSSVYAKSNVDLKFEKSRGLNVLGRLPISGNKAVLIGAHGDHLGHGELGSSLAKGPDEQGKIHYGADDNASGVAGVLEIAHFYSQLRKTRPQNIKKDIYVAVWSGEEIGVLGSSHFVKNWNEISNKEFKKYFSAYLNMDMIGRFKDKLYVQGVGSGDYWNQISEEVGLKNGVNLSLQEDPYLPTDSMAIYLAEVPSLNFFTGSHAEYHSPRDRAELINYSGLVKTIEVVKSYSQLISETVVDLVKYVKVPGQHKPMEGRSFRIYLGTIPDYTQEGVTGVRLSGVSKESPAEKAGLREKDVIVEFSGTRIANIYDYVYALQVARPDQETLIKVKRGESLVDLKIVPKLKE